MKRFVLITSILIFFSFQAAALALTDFTATLTDVFSPFTDSNEGRTAFRSLLIPPGGRAESMGCAFTGLSDDISYLNYNPAASSVLQNTQISFFHNAWIADSSMETLAATSRFQNLGIGAMISCFYVPFTEYDFFGARTSNGYYSETTAALNLSYNFLAGYDFKGLAAGLNLKSSLRGVPDYTDKDTGDIISMSGLSQSGIAFMADAGLMFRFNFAKFYASREPNVRIGASVQNIGVSFTGLGKKLQLDDPLPSSVALGASYNFIKPITFTLDFRQPFNMLQSSEYEMFQVGSGVEVQITDFISAMGGFLLKGANPRFSFGAEFELVKIRMNVNYTLDLTSSAAPINRISLSAKFQLGDKGRAELSHRIDELYNEGVYYFSQAEYDKAIEVWEQVLELDKRFDPAILGIKSAKSMIEMFQKIRESLFLE